MKKQQYVAAVACLVAGAIGFVSVYATEKTQEKRQLARQELVQEETQELSAASNELEPQPKVESVPKVENAKRTENHMEEKEMSLPDNKIEEADSGEEEAPQTTQTVADASNNEVEAMHFSKDDKTVWPVQGEVLLDYSMDTSIYFPTLEQYRCNPAMVISGNVNDKVFAMARGKIIEVFNDAETGCTVRQSLGDGYVATYGQLKELNVKVGDTLEGGQVIGYINEPTKYYSVEGSNVYFSLQKDGKMVNPRDYLPQEVIDTLE